MKFTKHASIKYCLSYLSISLSFVFSAKAETGKGDYHYTNAGILKTDKKL